MKFVQHGSGVSGPEGNSVSNISANAQNLSLQLSKGSDGPSLLIN